MGERKTTIAVSIPFWEFITDNQKFAETKEDTLKRLLKEVMKDE